MPPTITARDRLALLAAALSKVDEVGLRATLEGFAGRPGVPRAVANAANALRRSRALSEAVVRPPYRAVVPFLATAVAEDCLTMTVEQLGEDSDDPSREQLLAALDTLRDSFTDATIAVMLASVAADDMPASDLCFEVATSDERYDLIGWQRPSDGGGSAKEDEGGAPAVAPADRADLPTGDGAGHEGHPAAHVHRASEEQRQVRRARRKAAAEDRRRRQEAAQRAAQRARSVRKPKRPPSPEPTTMPAGSDRRPVPVLVRQPSLTPAQQREFDTRDPLVGAVVYAWVPFDRGATGDGPRDEVDGVVGVNDDGPRQPGTSVEGEETSEGGKLRPCVVIGASADHLLVRPGYSDGGKKSRDWTSVPVRHWQEAGFDQPTWIGVEATKIERPELATPPRRLSPADWNALW